MSGPDVYRPGWAERFSRTPTTRDNRLPSTVNGPMHLLRNVLATGAVSRPVIFSLFRAVHRSNRGLRGKKKVVDLEELYSRTQL